MRELSPRLLQYVQHRVSGKSAAESARLVGYSENYSKHAAEKIEGRNEKVRAMIDAEREKIRTSTKYDAERVIAELQDTVAFARQHKNPMAVVKALELIAKITGVLQERRPIDDVIDLAAALAAAKMRVPVVYDVTPPRQVPQVQGPPRLPDVFTD